MTRFGKLLTLFALPALLCSRPGALRPAVAQTEPDYSRWSFLVGVDDYENVDPLHYAVKDVKDVGKVLQRLHYPQDQVVVEANPNSHEMMTALDAMLAKMAEAKETPDTLLFYFSGHGFSMKGEDKDQFLATRDTDLNNLRETAVPMAMLLNHIKSSRVKNVFFIIDACRNDPTKELRVKGAEPARPKNFQKEMADSGDKNMVGLFSCADGQTSQEDPKLSNGIFTHCLIRQMRGRAADNGVLYANTLFTNVGKEVKTVTGGLQTPFTNQSAAPDLTLATHVPPDEVYLSDLTPTAQSPENSLQVDKIALSAGKEARSGMEHSLCVGESVTYALSSDYDFFRTQVGFRSVPGGRMQTTKCEVILSDDEGHDTRHYSYPVSSAEVNPIDIILSRENRRYTRLTLRVDREGHDENRRNPASEVWWGGARLSNEVDKGGGDDIDGKQQLTVCFFPNEKLRIKEWDLFIDGEPVDAAKGFQTNTKRKTVNVKPGQSKVSLYWQGAGYLDNPKDKDAKYSMIRTVPYIIDVKPGKSKLITIMASVKGNFFDKRLHIELVDEDREDNKSVEIKFR